jgi:hypothetical protein
MRSHPGLLKSRVHAEALPLHESFFAVSTRVAFPSGRQHA